MAFSMYTIQNQGQMPKSVPQGVRRMMADTSGEDVTVYDYAHFRVYELPVKVWESLAPKQVDHDHQYIVDHIAKAMQGGRRIPPVARVEIKIKFPVKLVIQPLWCLPMVVVLCSASVLCHVQYPLHVVF